ncbi:MAG: hypothetical protein ACYC56_14805, partial [Candidatus Aquicultor sp.]
MEKEKFFKALCSQTKFCTMSKALSFAAQSDYDLDVVSAIFSREDCLFPHMWILLTKVPHVLPVLEVAVKNKDFKKISFEQFYSLFVRARKEEGKNSYYVYNALTILADRKILNKFSVEELFIFSDRLGYMGPVMSCLGRKKQWQELPFDSAFDVLERKDSHYNPSLAKIVIGKQNCSLKKALEIFHDSRSPEEVFEAIIDRHNFKLDAIFHNLREPKWGKLEDVIMWNVNAIIARKDCSLKRSYELLEKAKQYDLDSFRYAAMALIAKDNLPFKKAIKLMKEISCTKQAISSFEKRKDFTLERRRELIRAMNESIPAIYEGGDTPDYDHYDLEEIIKKGDWITPPLHDALSLFSKMQHFDSSLQTISERPDWKKLSLNKAIKLAAETGNHTDVLQLIIATKKCPLAKALELALIPNSDLYDSHLLRTIIAEGIASYEESLEILQKSNDPMYTVTIMVEQTKVPLSGMINLFRNGFSQLGNLSSAISKHEEWATIPLATAFDYLPDSYMEPINVIVAREDWQALPFAEAFNLLKTIKWESHAYWVVPSLTKKVDCPLKSAYELIGLLDPSNDIREAVYPVMSMLDNPL